jgi:type I restriction-modification system DNA methylase subunit
MSATSSNQAFLQAHARVIELIDRFQSYAQEYLQPGYQEAQARQDFIDPLFQALGWDVDHEHQHNPYEQEVKIESGLIVHNDRAQKRADYAFYLAPNFRDVRFYVEAKKPSVRLEGNIDAHFQTLRYGYSAGTPLAVLTNFEQIRVLDCRRRPHPDGSAPQQVYKHWHCSELRDAGKFAEFYWLFSRQAHADGSYLRRIGELPKPQGAARQRGLFKGGYQSVDESFLLELAEHREALAKAFKKADEALDSAELTGLVQRTLDRLVFMRFLEDKQIETEVRVSGLGRGKNAWADFQSASARLDGIYNGIVFKPLPRLDDAGFAVDADIFGDICERLAAENSPYNFDAIPIHILGSIYERFLGSVIRATDKRVKVEEKPEVRKAGGVYYTPEYIVRYIVAQTVGRLIAGKTPDQIGKLRFADIACGSGSFLLGIYDELLRYHADWYNQPGREKQAQKAGCVKTDAGRWRLSLVQRRAILQNNIHGVDLDRQAVEVAQLSLFLKLLEDERAASATQYLLEFKRDANMKKLLPDLSCNIVCGNSLIGWDIAGTTGLSEEDELRLNPLDFRDTFPEVMRSGGFDAIVGNPPYVLLAAADLPEIAGNYLLGYETAEYKVDLFHLFIERGVGLLKDGGELGFITPNQWLTLKYNKKLRNFILFRTQIEEIVIQDNFVFDGVTVHTCLLFLEKKKSNSKHLVSVRYAEKNSQVMAIASWPITKLAQSGWMNNSLYEIEVRRIGLKGILVEKILNSGVVLSDVTRASLGCQAYNSSKHTKEQIENRVFHAEKKAGPEYLLELAGNDVSRYGLSHTKGKWIKYGPWLHDYRTMDWLTGPRVLVREICGVQPHALQATYVEDIYCNYKTILNVNPLSGSPLSMRFICGLLNSRVISFIYPFISSKMVSNAFPRLSVKDLRSLPYPPKERITQKKVKEIDMLVAQMLEAKKQENMVTTSARKEIAARKCVALDRQIDALVYDLYGLTEEEVRLVESSQ